MNKTFTKEDLLIPQNWFETARFEVTHALASSIYMRLFCDGKVFENCKFIIALHGENYAETCITGIDNVPQAELVKIDGIKFVGPMALGTDQQLHNIFNNSSITGLKDLLALDVDLYSQKAKVGLGSEWLSVLAGTKAYLNILGDTGLKTLTDEVLKSRNELCLETAASEICVEEVLERAIELIPGIIQSAAREQPLGGVK